MFIFIIIFLIPISYANIYVYYLESKRYFIILLYLFKNVIMVSNKCCVNGCHESSKTIFGIHIKDIAVWEKSLGTQLTSVSRMCAKNFKSSDIINTWVSGNGNDKYSVSFKILSFI